MKLFSFWQLNKLNGGSSSKKLQNGIYSEDEFKSIITRERVRCDRNGNIFSLVIFNLIGKSEKTIDQLKKILHTRGTRMVDEVGMIDSCNIGVCLHNTDKTGALCFIKNMEETIIAIIGQHIVHKVYVYPADWRCINNGGGDKNKFYKNNGDSKQSKPNLSRSIVLDDQTDKDFADYFNHTERLKDISGYVMPRWKRIMDITLSCLILVASSPLFLIIAILIKIIAPGPVFFKQKRVGFMAKSFTMIKFRSMKVGNCSNAHREYLAELINGKKDNEDEGGLQKPMIKRDNLNNLIPYGKLLRRSCIDELPQLINVIRGEMSLIGPRPPIYYEVEEYQNWHNGRFDAVPGITGLWQVSGKNRLTFEQMIRMDIRYSRQESFWLDVKIILKTPFAIFSQVLDSVQKNKVEGVGKYA